MEVNLCYDSHLLTKEQKQLIKDVFYYVPMGKEIPKNIKITDIRKLLIADQLKILDKLRARHKKCYKFIDCIDEFHSIAPFIDNGGSTYLKNMTDSQIRGKDKESFPSPEFVCTKIDEIKDLSDLNNAVRLL